MVFVVRLSSCTRSVKELTTRNSFVVNPPSPCSCVVNLAIKVCILRKRELGGRMTLAKQQHFNGTTFNNDCLIFSAQFPSFFPALKFSGVLTSTIQQFGYNGHIYVYSAEPARYGVREWKGTQSQTRTCARAYSLCSQKLQYTFRRTWEVPLVPLSRLTMAEWKVSCALLTHCLADNAHGHKWREFSARVCEQMRQNDTAHHSPIDLTMDLAWWTLPSYRFVTPRSNFLFSHRCGSTYRAWRKLDLANLLRGLWLAGFMSETNQRAC